MFEINNETSKTTCIYKLSATVAALLGYIVNLASLNIKIIIRTISYL